MPGLSTSYSILITVSTSGIGRALALAISALLHKAQVIACGRRLARLAELREKGSKSRRLDFGNLDGLNGEVDEILESYPELGCTQLDAGIQYQFDFSKLESVKMENVIQELTVNYTSALTTLTGFLPHFTVTILTSGLSLVRFPTVPNYCATEAALHSFTVSLRAMLRASGSTVMVAEVYPPHVLTLNSLWHDGKGINMTLQCHCMPPDEYIQQVMPPLLSGEGNIQLEIRRIGGSASEKGRRRNWHGLDLRGGEIEGGACDIVSTLSYHEMLSFRKYNDILLYIQVTTSISTYTQQSTYCQIDSKTIKPTTFIIMPFKLSSGKTFYLFRITYIKNVGNKLITEFGNIIQLQLTRRQDMYIVV
ncbi:hypothetical protein BDQ17DRAFT_1250239 [Cyathus striatus]|nr:hypothetical protein BDQ17DRAFT_1250239 [Cyathus striatus]